MLSSGRHRYAVVLALIAIAILALGYILKPAAKHVANRAENLTVTRGELENLQQLVRRNNLKNLSSNFVSSAEDATAHVIMMQPWSTNGVFFPDLGLVVAKRLDALPRQLSTATDSLFQPVNPGLWVPGLPFFIGHLQPGADVTPARLGVNAPAQGGWVLVVAHGIFGQMLLSPGIYDGLIQSPCGPFVQNRLQTTIPLDETHLGGGLFDLAGDLYGVVLPCDDGPAIIPVTEIKRALSQVTNDSGVALARYGLRFAPSASRAKSVAVAEVWDDWPADQAGVEPGDELISLDGQPITLPQEAAALLQRSESGEHDFRLRRDRRTITAHVNAMNLQTASSVRPAIHVEDQSGVVVARVPKGSSADVAGIRTSDRLLSIDGKPATKLMVDQYFGQFRVTEPIWVVVQRPGRRVQLLVKP